MNRVESRGFNAACILGMLALTATLAACGGGGDGGGGSAGFAPAATEPAQAAPATQTSVEAPTRAGDCSVSLYGDSIMVGVAPAFAQARGKYRIEHKAVPGAQLMHLDRTFNNDSRTARFVVIENGSIDAWQGRPPVLLALTLGAMADYVRAEGRQPVLTGPSNVAQFPGSVLPVFGEAGRAQFEVELKKVVADQGIAFADWGSVHFEGAADVPDGIHPRQAYSERLALRLAETLDKLAPECAM